LHLADWVSDCLSRHSGDCHVVALVGFLVMVHNQNLGGQVLSKVVTKVDKFQSRSGQIVELRHMRYLILENNVLRKEEVSEISPPLADSRKPDSACEIRECCICLGLYHEDNTRTCPVCGQDFCCLPPCKGTFKTGESLETTVCAVCAVEVKKGPVRRLWRRLWQLGD
jgi:hypothetical protein